MTKITVYLDPADPELDRETLEALADAVWEFHTGEPFRPEDSEIEVVKNTAVGDFPPDALLTGREWWPKFPAPADDLPGPTKEVLQAIREGWRSVAVLQIANGSVRASSERIQEIQDAKNPAAFQDFFGSFISGTAAQQSNLAKAAQAQAQAQQALDALGVLMATGVLDGLRDHDISQNAAELCAALVSELALEKIQAQRLGGAS